MTRTAMWFLLAVVAVSAAVLSFASLRSLAELCGFSTALSPLLPVVVDAGAAAGCLAWMSGTAQESARRYARALTLLLLVASVCGNAVTHGLTAYGLRPHWGLVVTVSAAAPAVLGAVVHLAVLIGRGGSLAEPETDAINTATDAIDESTPESRTPEPEVIAQRDIPETAPPAEPEPAPKPVTPKPRAPRKPKTPAAERQAAYRARKKAEMAGATA